jgi:hypothetical protein
MSKILITAIIVTFLGVNAHADIKDVTLNKISEKVSSTASNLIPGEGLTEVDISVRDDNEGNPEVQFDILGVRDLIDNENFTQFSLHSQDVNGDKRAIGNIGLGYRELNADQSMMIGGNIFYDVDLFEQHQRLSMGLEARAAIIDFNYNYYQEISNNQIVDGINEKVLSGQEYNLSSQLPYMPWTTFNIQGYRFENEKAAQDTKGNIYSLEMALTPSLAFDVENDVSSVDGQDDMWNYRLIFTHPPRTNKATLMDGLTSDVAFVKANMQDKLKDKVRRNNNLVVEIQGAVIITKK